MLERLSEEQRKAVLQEGNVLLKSCPGSGKTRTLTYKLAYELSKIEQEKKYVVALTYTNRAADEIKHRIEEMNIDCSKLYVSTIHSFCLDWIIKPYSCYSDRLNKGYILIDEYKSDKLKQEVKNEYGIKYWEEVNTRYNRSGTFENSTVKQELAAQKYHEKLIHDNFIDFDLILFLAYKLLKDNPQIANTLSKLIHIICVDEYQDTQDLQYGIIGKIINAGEHRTKLFLVGDSDQAIYASLGGVAKMKEEISEEIGYLPITELALSGNYRSTQRIIDYYRNFQIEQTDITALNEEIADEAGLITFSSRLIHKDQLDEEIARLITASLNNGIPENEICVVAPRWNIITALVRKLKAHLPNTNFDAPGLLPFRKSTDNFWYKLARLFLVEPSPKKYLTRLRWAKEILDEINTKEGFNNLYSSNRSILKLANSICPDENDGLEFLEKAFVEFMKILNVNFENDELLSNQWDSFFDGALARIQDADYTVPTDISSFKRLFNHSDGVVVNTCYGVKGEEYETVITFGNLRGFIPHWNNIDFNDPSVEVPHSKRMLYVICSRAKKNLHIIAEDGRKTTSKRDYQVNEQLVSIEFDYDLL